MKTKYKRLDEYIEDVYYNLLFSKIKSFILNNKFGGNSWMRTKRISTF